MGKFEQFSKLNAHAKNHSLRNESFKSSYDKRGEKAEELASTAEKNGFEVQKGSHKENTYGFTMIFKNGVMHAMIRRFNYSDVCETYVDYFTQTNPFAA